MEEQTTLRGPLVIVDPHTGAKLFELGIRETDRAPFLALYHPHTGLRLLEAGPVADAAGSSISLFTAEGQLGGQLQVLAHGGHVTLYLPDAQQEPEPRAALECSDGEGAVIISGRCTHPVRLTLGG